MTVEGFDAGSVQETVPHGAAAYVQSVRVNVSPQQQHHHRDAAERLIAVPL